MKILMVCLGNICRSPIAEGLLKQKFAHLGLDWQVESCGTERYHVGESADKRGIKVCKEKGLDISSHIARRLTLVDFEEYDIIYALAVDVYQEISWIAKSEERMKKVILLLEEVYPNQNLSVKDPYYGKEKDFAEVYEQLDWVCDEIITKYTSK
jgi:protein-tyrosine phosphatase